MFSLLLLTLNAPLQMGKCTPRGTCAPGWDLWYNLMSLFCFSYHQVRSQLWEFLFNRWDPGRRWQLIFAHRHKAVAINMH